MKKIFIESYGCSSSLADAEIIAGLLREAGFQIVKKLEDSNLNIIVTCTVKLPTEQKMIYKIKQLTKLKKPLIVAGCMPKVQRKIIEETNPKASLIGPDSIEEIAGIVSSVLNGKRIIFLKDLRRPKLCLPRISKNKLIRIVEIATGCDGSCRYCIVRLAKGKLFSYPTNLIVTEIKQAVKDGAKEMWITSQDCGAYNYNEHKLPELLNEICGIKGNFLVRIGMMNPNYVVNFLDELIEAYGKEKIFKFLHLPVQSGSDKILKLMGRKYNVRDFLKIVRKFKKEFPRLFLSTDIIVGFPGETESDFKKTVELIKKMKPDIVNISKFGLRTGTEAAKMQQLDKKIVNERSSILSNLVRKIELESNRKWIGWKGKVLVDEKIRNGFLGKNFAYKPVIIKTKKNILGKFFDVEIIDVTHNCLTTK